MSRPFATLITAYGSTAPHRAARPYAAHGLDTANKGLTVDGARIVLYGNLSHNLPSRILDKIEL
jgi:hypothetical protein